MDGIVRREFESLLAPVAGVAYRVAYGLTHDRDEALDLVQEATVLAFRGFGTFQSGTNFRAWFLRILTNRFVKSRSKKRLESVSIDEADDVYLFKMTHKAGLHGNSDDPAGLLFDGLDAEAVQSAMDSLPEDYRMAAILYFLNDFSYDQIAEVLAVPVGTVRSRLHRGRKLLQRSLWDVAVSRGIVEEAQEDVLG